MIYKISKVSSTNNLNLEKDLALNQLCAIQNSKRVSFSKLCFRAPQAEILNIFKKFFLIFRPHDVLFLVFLRIINL